MKRLIPIAIALAALVAPGAASARVVELGAKLPAAEPSCPDDCAAIGKVTMYAGSGRGRAARSPYTITRPGRIVAFTVPLGDPAATQTDFFVDAPGGPAYGNPPQVRLSVLRPGTSKRRRKNHRLVAQSELFNVNPFLGSSPTFALRESIRVGKGAVIGLTTPTWLPNLAVNLEKSIFWKSSREAETCDNLSQDATLTELREITAFGCTYFEARPLYTVTFIPDPRPTQNTE